MNLNLHFNVMFDLDDGDNYQLVVCNLMCIGVDQAQALLFYFFAKVESEHSLR